MNAVLTLYVWMMFSHCLFDYPLQGDFLARAKRRGGVPGVPWAHALFAHAFLQAGGVMLVTGSLRLFACELVAHWAIDYWKCSTGEFGSPIAERYYSIDQQLHWLCKLLWIILLTRGWA